MERIAGLLEDIKSTRQVAEMIERDCASLSSLLASRDREIRSGQSGPVIDISLCYCRDLQNSLQKMKLAKIDLQKELESSESEGRASQRKLQDLRRDVAGLKKKVEFKTNLEKSFQSLQLQYQAKVDQLEKMKRIGSLREALS